VLVNVSVVMPTFFVCLIEGLLYSLLNVFIIIVNPENMGIETFFVQIYTLLAKIQPKTSFSVMAICIIDIHGKFSQLFNIANRFLHVFVSLVVPIKNIFPGGA